MSDFYREALHFTQAFDGQYPRPWMTDLTDPLSANCFIVGRNQKKGYSVEVIGEHSRHVDALFNRNGQSCRALYDSFGPPSPTRKNIDRLAARLKNVGAKVLETNVICFSSRMSADLSASQKQKGTEIFSWLLSRVQPKVIVVHGIDAARDLRKMNTASARVIEMPSLAPPAYSKWARQSEEMIYEISEEVRSALAT